MTSPDSLVVRPPRARLFGMHALLHATNIRGSGAAAAADQAGSLGVPLACCLAERKGGGTAAPLLGRSIIALARIRIRQQRLVGLAMHSSQQRRDVLRRRAVDAYRGDLCVAVQFRGAPADVFALAVVGAVLAGEADPGVHVWKLPQQIH